MKNKPRYEIRILFKGVVHPWHEKVSSLAEAKKYRSMIDDTVMIAFVIDALSGNLKLIWK